MKKLLSLSLLCLGLLGGARAQTCGTTITSYPYIENFDGATAPGWASSGFTSSWALGTPAKTIINSAASGTKSWVTGLTGQYLPFEQSSVESPCFNMSTLLLPVVEMKVWWNSEYFTDGAVLQSSIDVGNTWQNVGAKGDPNNWFNYDKIMSAPGGQSANTAEGWSGRNTTSNGSGGWVTVKHVLIGLGGKPNVKLRIAFGADGSGQDDGFAFDNFTIYETPANDASVTSITSPGSPVVPSSSQPVMVTLKNSGTSPLTSATLGFSVNNVVQPTFPWTGNLALNATSAPVQIGTIALPAGVHKIKAWSKTPNGAVDGNPGNDTTSISVYSCNTLTGSFTINKGATASATNFTSFSLAAQALSTCGIGGPVIFNVAPGSGSYSEVLNLTNISGTSATNTITINGNGNTIIGSPLTASDAVVKLDGAKFIRFNNLKIEITSTATAGSGVLLTNNSSNNTFNGCTITYSIASTANLYGINISAGSSNNTFQNNTIKGGNHGVYANGASAALLTNNQFTGNALKDQYTDGFYCGYSTNSLVEGNDISRPARANTATIYSGIYLTTGSANITVSKNSIHNTHDAASTTTGSVYGVYSEAVTTTGNENIIKNNLIYNINNAGGSLNALYNQSASGTFYYHNTVSADNPAISFGTLRGLSLSSGPNNVKFINNILSLSSTATTKQAIFISSASTALTSNNNDIFVGTTGNVGFYAGAAKATLADWKTVNAKAYDQNSVSADPLFVNSASYLLPLSTAVDNKGQALISVTDDINGAVRSTTTPDPGALEFTPAAIDAGVTAIVAPASSVTPGSNLPVQVTLKNFGTADLTTATIGWSVNGIPQANYSWSGNLTNLQSSAPIGIGTYIFPAGNFTIKVWSKLPNGAADPLAVNDTTILRVISCAPLLGNYTINKNNPTAGTNFQSISEATQRLNSCGVSGAVTFTVAPGTGPYNEQVEIASIPNTSATNTIIFEGNGNTVAAAPGTKPGIIVLNGAKYVKLNNFVISLDVAATTGWGVQLINAADFNTISNNTINLPINSASTTINGIVAGASTSTAGNNTSNTRIANNIINGGYYGIQINGNTGGLNADNNQITGNQIRDPFLYGIHVSNANGTLVEKNDISRPTRTNGTTLYNIYLAGTTLKTIVSKNRIHNANDMSSTKTGILHGIFIAASATVGNENIIRNNAIYNLNNAGGNVFALTNANANGTYYYNNTITSDPAISYGTLRGLYFTAASNNMKFINNIISLPGTATAKHAIYMDSPSLALVSNNNDLYVGTTGNIGYYAADMATLADWKLANKNAYDQNSVSVDPAFVSPATGNLKPSEIAIDKLGQPLAAVTDDILGAARNTTTPDMGAFEFDIVTNDVGITAVSGPGTTGCGLSATETITVTIKNYGVNTQTTVPVSFSVNGTAIASETYTGSIAPNATATYTFTAKANLATSGSYVIIANTLLPGDSDANNDVDTLNINNSLITGLPVTFDFETTNTGITRFRKVTNAKSNITEGTGASNGTGSIKGMILDAVVNTNWLLPAGTIDPWTNNPDNASGAYICISPAGGLASDSLWMTFDLKQLFKTTYANTNFRVTVNGTQSGATFQPPFSGTGGTTNWTKVKVDLTKYKNDPFVTIGLESSVKEEYANGTGTANLIDNIEIKRRITTPTGLKGDLLASQVHVFPNPGKGQFNVNLPAGKVYTLEVTDLTGKVINRQQTNGNAQLNLEGTAKGIYLLKVSGENGSAVRKLIVE